jgi:hypothetical protein
MITEEMIKDLSIMIMNEIKADFEVIFYSGNLRDTLYVEPTGNGVKVVIEAEMYDLLQYKKNSVIIYTGEGSYANEVDIKGGFSGKHQDYVIRSIQNGITQWFLKYNLQGVVNER